MKRYDRHSELWVSSMLMLLLTLLAACTGDHTTDMPQGVPLQLSSVTRTSSALIPDENSNIKLFVTTKEDGWAVGEFNYDNVWVNNGLSVKEHTQYYIYGFMPNDAALLHSSSIAKPVDERKDYSGGADLTLEGLPVFTDKDICIVVGVRQVNNTETDTEPVEGNYSYQSVLASQNYVNLLMDHLYSQLILRFNIDEKYSQLRHIHLKEVKLTSTYGEKVNATIRLKAGSGLITNTVDYSKYKDDNTSDTKTLSLLEAEKDLTTTPVQIGSVLNCVPRTFDANGTYLTISCKYDVYNKDNDKVLRQDCIVTNKLKLSNMSSGTQRTVTLTVSPTYLYVLSDDDLNNPTITVN